MICLETVKLDTKPQIYLVKSNIIQIVFNTKYNSSIKKQSTDVNYENFITEFKINNLVTSFDYLNENNTEEKIHI